MSGFGQNLWEVFFLDREGRKNETLWEKLI